MAALQEIGVENMKAVHEKGIRNMAEILRMKLQYLKELQK